ncbi:PAS domain S-box protein [Magnetospirillum sulfuroxidans]|uniref:histidine kinase n=1 Tax=Magnetospirillum sulfuroxidans TaxID=611300 RepID=A0ABS5ICB0_9PROT|nr:PAS domain S-box protein [Magnetospirillum sulfuroxidans]MBR9971959.1 PAS domain S-box protein [Magnetospirillum sulfuroxidans]
MNARIRLLLPFMVLLTAVLGIMHFVIFDMLKQRLIADKLHSEQQALAMVSLAIAPDLLSGDMAKIYDTLNDVWAERLWWRSMTLERADGRLLFPLHRPVLMGGLTKLSSPVRVDRRDLAVLTIHSDIPATIADSLGIMAQMEIIVILLLLAGAALVVHLQGRWLLTPLAGLARAAFALSQGSTTITLPRASGEVGVVVTAFTDMMRAVSSREAALRHSESRLAAVIDSSGEAVITLNANTVIISCNKAAENIFGYEQREVAGLPLSQLLPHHPCTPTSAEGCETIGHKVDGSDVALWLILTEITVADGRLFVATISDITSRKQAEAELRESESRFRDLAGSASDWFWETDDEHRLTFVSERLGAVLGVKPSAIIGFSYMDLGLADAEPGLVQSHLDDLASCRPFRDVVFPVGPLGGKDGRFIRISGLPLFDNDGCFLGYRGVGADITREVIAERQAKEARQRLADAIESINDSIAVYDAEDRLVLFNQECRRVFSGMLDSLKLGMTFEQIISASATIKQFDQDGVPTEEWRQNRLAVHRAATGEPTMQHLSDGRWLLSREYRTADGGVVAVRTDITLLKQREEALDTLQRRYQLILDAAGDGIIGLDAQGLISFANRAACDLLGIGDETIVGHNYHTLIDPESANDSGNAVRRAYTLGLAEKVEDALFRHGDGRALQVEYLVAPILEQHNVVGAVVVFRDVSLRRLYEQTLADQQQLLEQQVAERTAALSASQQRLRGISDNLFEGVLVVDEAGQISFANNSARGLLQCPHAQGLALDQVMRLGVGTDLIGFTRACWPKVIADGKPNHDDDARFVTAAGTTLNVAFGCSPLIEQGRCVGAIISFRDIGQLKNAQQEALQSSRLASVGQLAAGIAHEINTPIQYVGDNLRFVRDAIGDMANVLAMARTLAHSSDSGNCQDFETAYAAADIDYLKDELPTAIDQSLDGVAQVSRIVLSMKEFSHPGSSHKSMTDINRALDSTLTVSRNTWKQVATIETDFAADLPPVQCHAGEINQVFLNLITNAAHAIEASGKPLPGRIAITTRKDRDNVRISIQDSGTGISSAIKEKIFDPFFTTKSVGKGTGQGLAICLDVIKIKHGGRLDVNGNEGNGAEFVITLPIDGSAEASAND